MEGRVGTARRVWIALACIAALAIGIGLAYWQWTRFESASGTLQNLGYVLQWPLFGIFPAFMVWRIYRYVRQEHGELTDEGAKEHGPELEQFEPRAARSRMAYIAPTVSEDSDDDPALARYNALLAELAAEDAASTPIKEQRS